MLSRRLYQLQSRLALTAAEATALLVLTGALALGLGVRQLQGRTAPPADALVAADARWAALDAAASTAPGSVPASDTGPAAGGQALPADSLGEPAGSITIPTSGFADPPPRSRRASASSPVRMNLNTADAALLQRLPRIGPALAGRILAYRQERGPFRRVEDVVNVRGIGPKTLEQIAPWLYVE